MLREAITMFLTSNLVVVMVIGYKSENMDLDDAHICCLYVIVSIRCNH